MEKLNPLNNDLNVVLESFNLELTHLNTSSCYGTAYVQTKDAFWDFPTSLFNNCQGVASPQQEVRRQMIKNIIDPFKFEMNPGAFTEGNITTVGFYTLGNNEIPVTLNANNFVAYVDPFNQTLGFDMEFLRCMAWNDTQMSYQYDGSCGQSLAWEIIPCQSCTF